MNPVLVNEKQNQPNNNNNNSNNSNNMEGEVENWYADQMNELRNRILNLQNENRELRLVVANFKANLEDPNEKLLLADMEEEVNKWESLYYELAEMGGRKLEQLEEELENLKQQQQQASSKTTTTKEKVEDDNKEDDADEDAVATATAAAAAMAAAEEEEEEMRIILTTSQLEDMVASEQAKRQKLKEYKKKAKQKVAQLKELLEKTQTEREREVQKFKAQERDEISMMHQIEYLEMQLQASGLVLKRERTQAHKRESKLKKQLRATQKLSYLPVDEEEEDSAEEADIGKILSIFVKLMGERMCGCFDLDTTEFTNKSGRGTSHPHHHCTSNSVARIQYKALPI